MVDSWAAARRNSQTPEALRARAWGWVDEYRRLVWEAHNPGANPTYTHDAKDMCPAMLDEPLRSAVWELLLTFPADWFERERLTTFGDQHARPVAQRRQAPEAEPSRVEVASRLAAFVGVTLFLLFLSLIIVPSTSGGVLGFAVDWVPILFRSQVIYVLAVAGSFYLIRVWIAIGFGWADQGIECVIGQMILYVGGGVCFDVRPL